MLVVLGHLPAEHLEVGVVVLLGHVHGAELDEASAGERLAERRLVVRRRQREAEPELELRGIVRGEVGFRVLHEVVLRVRPVDPDAAARVEPVAPVGAGEVRHHVAEVSQLRLHAEERATRRVDVRLRGGGVEEHGARLLETGLVGLHRLGIVVVARNAHADRLLQRVAVDGRRGRRLPARLAGARTARRQRNGIKMSGPDHSHGERRRLLRAVVRRRDSDRGHAVRNALHHARRVDGRDIRTRRRERKLCLRGIEEAVVLQRQRDRCGDLTARLDHEVARTRGHDVERIRKASSDAERAREAHVFRRRGDFDAPVAVRHHAARAVPEAAVGNVHLHRRRLRFAGREVDLRERLDFLRGQTLPARVGHIDLHHLRTRAAARVRHVH